MDCLEVISPPATHATQPSDRSPGTLPGFSGDAWAAQILQPIAPMIDDAFQRLVAIASVLAEDVDNVRVDPEGYATDWFRALYRRLLTMIARTVVLEMHVARVEARLEGDTPEERFATFCHDLGQEASLDQFFAEYPVLKEQIEQLLEQTIEAACECLQRLIEDAPRLVVAWRGANVFSD